MFRIATMALVLIVCSMLPPGSVLAGEPGNSKIGQNALARLAAAEDGEKVEIDVTFSAVPYAAPFHQHGLDDDPRDLMTVRESILAAAGLTDRDVTFDAADIGVMSLMIDMGQAQEIDRHPNVRSLGVLPEMQGFTIESAALSNFPYVWNAGFTGSGVKVAIIDNGFSPGHPALSFVSSEYCYAREGTIGYCGGGNDFASGPGAANYIGSNTGTQPGEYSQIHGTSVLATIAQLAVPPTYVEPGLMTGISPVLFNIGGTTSVGFNYSGGYTAGGLNDALNSMRLTGVNSDINIINMSFGYWNNANPAIPCGDLDALSTSTIISALRLEGKLIVAAAGNTGDNRTIWPACLPSVVTVAASWNVDATDTCGGTPTSMTAGDMACWSSYGDHVDLTGPGIHVTLARSMYNSGVYTHDSIERSGTSFSAPATAACAAALKQANPSITPEQLRTALTISPTTAVQPGTGFQAPLLDCAHALANSSAPQIPLANAGLSGAWYEPRTAGQGFYVNVYPSTGTAFAGWFTYDTTDTGPNGRRWYTLQNSTPFSGSDTQTTMTIYRSTGGQFDTPPSASSVAVGTATLSFTSCLSGQLSYSFHDGRTGVIPLSRLDTPFCNGGFSGDVAYTGVWYRAGLDGQGLTLRIIPSEQKLIGGWFTYTAAGGSTPAAQEWYALDNGGPGVGRPPGTAWDSVTKSASFGIYASSGGLFNEATPNPTSSMVGSGTIQFTGCNSATLTYNFTGGGSGSIPLTRLGPAPGPC